MPLLGNMGSMQREIRPSMQREDQPTMATRLEQIAACCEPTAEEPGAGNPHAGFCGNVSATRRRLPGVHGATRPLSPPFEPSRRYAEVPAFCRRGVACCRKAWQ